MALDVNAQKLFLPDNYEYKFVKYEAKEGSNFTAVFKIKSVTTKDQAKEWLTAYQEKSKLTWRVLRTRSANGTNNMYRCDFKCQHNTDKRGGKNPKIQNKDTNCPGVLKITIKRYFDIPKHRSLDEETREYPCIIELFSWHNHLTDSSSALRYRSMSATTRDKLLHYYQMGHTAASARHALQTDLLLNNADEYSKLSADNSIVPTRSIIQHLFNNTFSKMYGDKTSDNSKHLQDFLANYQNTTGGKVAFKTIENHIAIALCTPIMLRTIKYIPQVQELILIDASGNFDNLNHRVYFFLTPCVAGGVPIGCIVTDAETENVFLTGVELLKSILPDEIKSGPEIFMIDGDLKERKVLTKLWPDSKILLCQFHILKAVWRWVLDNKHGIPKEERQELYFMIKDFVYAQSEDILLEKYDTFTKNITHENFLTYIAKLWQIKHLWASCYRQNLTIRGNNTNNYIEALFRILKDLIFERVKAGNLVQLIDFITTKYENYLFQRYLDFSQGKYNKTLLKKFLVHNNTIMDKDLITYDDTKNVYTVKSKDEDYTVDIRNNFCTCYVGNTGQLCKHIASVLAHNDQISNQFFYNDTIRNTMFQIATNSQSPPLFLAPLNFNPNTTNSAHSQELVPNKISHNKHTIVENNTHNEEVNASVVDVTDHDKEKARQILEAFTTQLQDGIDKNPENFVPAILALGQNIKKYAATQSGLISAMHTFGKPHYKSINKKRGTAISVQPTAVGRRKFHTATKRKLSAGRKPLNQRKKPKFLIDHDYTNFGPLPKKAPHNLQQCVLSNVSLG